MATNQQIELNQIKDSISSKEDRVEYFSNFISELHDLELDFLTKAINYEELDYISHNEPTLIDEKDEEIKQLQDDFGFDIQDYVEALEEYVIRLKKPLSIINLYKDKLDFYKNMKEHFAYCYKCQVIEISKMVQDDIDYIKSKPEINKDKYYKDKSSMITSILFQPPHIETKRFFEQSIINAIFSKWNAQDFAEIYKSQLYTSLST